MAQTRQHLWTNSQVDEIREQRDQLMEAKRAALKVADERSKENCALRQENERLRAALKKIAEAEDDAWLIAEQALRDLEQTVREGE